MTLPSEREYYNCLCCKFKTIDIKVLEAHKKISNHYKMEGWSTK